MDYMTNTPLFGVMLWAVPRFRRQEAPLRQTDQSMPVNKPILALKEERTDICSFEAGVDAFSKSEFAGQ
ncbi:MAG: hypothetical protein KGH75_08625 [Rhodospirillales bacterium]|nr:hypothetical protein [Rhodospirillales bacterium]